MKLLAISKLIETDEELEAAATQLETIDMKENPTPDELKLAGVIDLLIQDYDNKIQLPERTPLDMVKFLMSARAIEQREMEPLLGTRSVVSEVLSGKRGLSIAMIRRLSEFFQVSTDLFIGKVEPKTRTKRSKVSGTKKTKKRPVVASR